MPGSICNGSKGCCGEWESSREKNRRCSFCLCPSLRPPLSLSRFLSFPLSLCFFLPVLCGSRATTLLLLPEVFPHRLIAYAWPWYPLNAAASQRDVWPPLSEIDLIKILSHYRSTRSFNGRHMIKFSLYLIFPCLPAHNYGCCYQWQHLTNDTVKCANVLYRGGQAQREWRINIRRWTINALATQCSVITCAGEICDKLTGRPAHQNLLSHFAPGFFHAHFASSACVVSFLTPC